MPAKFYQQLITLLVVASFVGANFGIGKSYDLWVNAWAAISGFLALGVGMKMVKDVAMAKVSQGPQNGGVTVSDSNVTVEAQKPVTEGEVLRSPEGQ